MATINRRLSQPRTGETPNTTQPIVKPPKPFFLRSWFALVITVGLVAAHIYGWQKAQIDPLLFGQKASNITRVLGQLLTPDLITHDQAQLQLTSLKIVGANTVPTEGKPAQSTESAQPVLKKGTDPDAIAQPDALTYNAQLTASIDTVLPGQKVTISGTGLRPNTPGQLIWQSTGTSASSQAVGSFISDANGNFTGAIEVPTDPERVVNTYNYPNTLIVAQTWDVGSPYISATVGSVLDKVIETVFVALMGTTFAIIVSIPLSFLASRNLMAHSLVGTGVYALARTLLNILRSIEVLILAIIFAATVGIGPFAGVLALSIHSVASLGKLYSEAIESIDPGPIEAITATGANRLQVIMYAVVPQFIPQFISFTLYRWDINVRMSTVLGLVGGGGIGFLLNEFIGRLQWNQAGTAILFIAIVVIAMDYASAKIRAAVI